MEYFLLKQDDRYTAFPRLLHVREQVDVRDIHWSGAHNIPDPLIFQIQMEAEAPYLDLLDRQLLLFSDKLKKLVEMYEPDILFKLTPLINMKHHRQRIYYLPIFEDADVLAASSEFNTDRSVLRKPVLDRRKVKGKRILRIQESVSPMLAIRLDVAESLLRRDFIGLRLERLQME